MTQENKELLLKVLCELLPYGVKVKTPALPFCMDKYVDTPVGELLMDGSNICIKYKDAEGTPVTVSLDWLMYELKPYLRPMERMTKEEQEEFVKFHCVNICPIILTDMLTLDNESKMFDWLNAHHFDYRGLIPMGLALEAPEGMYEI